MASARRLVRVLTDRVAPNPASEQHASDPPGCSPWGGFPTCEVRDGVCHLVDVDNLHVPYVNEIGPTRAARW